MNWITDFVKPQIMAWTQRNETPDNLWVRCPGCERMVFRKDLEQRFNVCMHCEYHLPWPVRKRLEALFDTQADKPDYQDITDIPQAWVDPLGFRDLKKYVTRLKEARSKTHEHEAIVVAYGHVGGRSVVVAALQFEFIGGSMGVYVGEALIRAAEWAVEKRIPLLAVTSSGGARMQEGAMALMQMPRSVLATLSVREAGLPYFVLMTHPTTGGVSASFASLGDIMMAEPQAIIGFTGRRVIEETIRMTLPHDFQTSEFQYRHGFLDQVVPRAEFRDRLIQLLNFFDCEGRSQANTA